MIDSLISGINQFVIINIMQKRSRSKTALPKIQSQDRIAVLFRKSSPIENYDGDYLGQKGRIDRQVPKSMVGCKSSKAFNYESSSAAYSRKICLLQKKSVELSHQIQRMQKKLETLRSEKNNIKEINAHNDMIQSRNTQISRKITKLTNPTEIQNEIKITEDKIERMRKRVDKEKEKNIKISKEINMTRRELNTSKNVIKSIQGSLSMIIQSYNQQLTLHKQLDLQIKQLNTRLVQESILSSEQKALLKKQYEDILKKLNEELHEQKNEDGEKSEKYFYMTEIQRGSNKSNNQNKKVINVQNLKNKLEKYQSDLSEIKQWAGLNNPDQITNKFLQKHEENFQQYEFLQNNFQILEMVRREKQQLVQRRNNLKMQLFSQPLNQINALNCKIEEVEYEKQCYRKNLLKYDQVFQTIKEIMKKYGPHIGLGVCDQIQQEKLEEILMKVNNFKTEVDFNNEMCDAKTDINKCTLDKILEEELQSVKKSGLKEESQRLLTRNDFLGFRDSMSKKKKRISEKQN